MSLVIVWMTADVRAASADAWDYIATSKDGLVSFYGNHRGIAMHGAIQRARLLYDYKEAQLDPDTLIANRSTIAVTLVDCSNRKMASIEGSDYSGPMGSGKIVSRSRQLPDARPQYVPAESGTVDDDVLNYVCGAARGRQKSATR
jgi:Surface-adhesin protein E